MTNSNLCKTLFNLSQNSIESVQTGNGFSEIDNYLHTERPISSELLDRMIDIDQAGGGIILLVGSSGDGKSHLLSKVKSLGGNGWSSDSFYNDATASCSPNKTAIETLKEALMDFSDDNLYSTNKKKILAINLGKLNAFIDDTDIRKIYGEIAKAAAPLFDDNDSTPPLNTERVKIVEFSNKQVFELFPDNEGYDSLKSDFLSNILDKLVAPNSSSKKNPFYAAYEEDMANGINPRHPVFLNYQLLMIPEVRRSIVLTVIEAIIRFKLVITPREYLDFIYSILVPKELPTHYKERESFYESLLPTLLYSGESNAILEAISRLDPMKYSNTIHDNTLSLLFSSNRIPDGFLSEIPSGAVLPEELINRINKFYDNNGKDAERTTKFLFRFHHLLDYHSESESYISFMNLLKGIFKQNPDYMMEAYNLVSEAIPRHNGSYYQKPNLIPLNIQGGKYKLFAQIQMDPNEPKYIFSFDKPWEFYPRFQLCWTILGNKEVTLLMDYALFAYLFDLRNGKLAITYENEKNIEFSHFLRELASLSDCAKKLTIAKVGSEDMTLQKTMISVQLQ
ncbi:MAG: DNA phosphorothioation-dependent restriction protein DptF [Paludibacter sp.]|nr:DNA phosphorothioation-dependent restriction protein DptF [Bacteroidales bacterium]MCM1069352.1 DNA phosphorothioation-dependent restriction protein DptF [Prevotella sp.]MCM1353872.1 DNA phosphorothioation-dependent restriction protein DptF [Bacteroides sp.]MCM1442878.1 DNA phosphorothioation-dependent restriction protein DptF [Muribaculum sp.]MCM1481923.1 DNA phosphorothioation-dependent restriction protein DptF [Paludibacter sp.]